MVTLNRYKDTNTQALNDATNDGVPLGSEFSFRQEGDVYRRQAKRWAPSVPSGGPCQGRRPGTKIHMALLTDGGRLLTSDWSINIDLLTEVLRWWDLKLPPFPILSIPSQTILLTLALRVCSNRNGAIAWIEATSSMIGTERPQRNLRLVHSN